MSLAPALPLLPDIQPAAPFVSLILECGRSDAKYARAAMSAAAAAAAALATGTLSQQSTYIDVRVYR